MNIIYNKVNYYLDSFNKTARIEKQDINLSGNIEIGSIVYYNRTDYNIIGMVDNAFKDCINIKRVEINNPNLIISSNAFENCYNLEYIYLDVLQIKDYAFVNCKNLKEIKLYRVNVIGAFLFVNCKKLEKIIYKNLNDLTWDNVNKDINWDANLPIVYGNLQLLTKSYIKNIEFADLSIEQIRYLNKIEFNNDFIYVKEMTLFELWNKFCEIYQCNLYIGVDEKIHLIIKG